MVTLASKFVMIVTLIVPAIGGKIEGTVRDSEGGVVSGGTVRAFLISPTDQSRHRVSVALTTTITSGGAFQINLLRPGNYRLCAQPKATWIGSCAWDGKGTTAFVWSDEASVQVPIIVPRGGFVLVRVNDPAQLLVAHEGRTIGAQLLIGVSASDLTFYRAAVSANDPGSRSYRLIVPVDRQLRLTVRTNFFHLTDNNNVPLPPLGYAIPVLVPAAQFTNSSTATQQPPTVVLNVTGVGK